MNATRLDGRHVGAVRKFLTDDPIGNVFLIGVFERFGVAPVQGGAWWACFSGDRCIDALLYSSPKRVDGLAQIAAVAGDTAAGFALGVALEDAGGAAWVVGERAAADSVWAGMGNPAARVRSDQILMHAVSVNKGSLLDVREAVLADLPWVLHASSSMSREDLGVEEPAALRPDRALFGEMVAVHQSRRVYRAKVTTECSAGAQVGGIWVEPDFRGRGLGQSATRALVTCLLARHPRVTLHVRADNRAAIRCYEAVGFQAERDFRVLVR